GRVCGSEVTVMAYETGPANGVDDLLDKLRLFAIGLGWTVDRFDTTSVGTGTGTSNNGKWLQLHHADAGYHNRVSDNRIDDVATNSYPKPYIHTFGATGVNTGSANYRDQPGASWQVSNKQTTSASFASTTNGLRGPFKAYHFFGTSFYLHVVIEIVAGEYAHLGVGRLDKCGDYQGGEYGYGTSWYYYLNSTSAWSANAHDSDHGQPFDAYSSQTSIYRSVGYLRLGHGDFNNEWARPYSGSNSTFSTISGPGRETSPHSYRRNPYATLWNCTPNITNGVSPFIPSLIMFQQRDKNCFTAGEVRDYRFVNMTNLVPGQVITLGSDQWLCFPIKAKGSKVIEAKGQVNSWRYGIAYRKVI
ncbi:MAG: hypothetical protein ACR2PT_24310, partial [Endozoicomonas sp.]